MKSYTFLPLAISLLACAASTATAESPLPNSLSEEEKAAGWQLLFDGENADLWRTFGKPEMPESGWEVMDGWLIKKGGVKPGNIITKEKFTDFEFIWEWRMAEGENNGVKYFVDEDRGNLGHEYQMLPKTGAKPSKSSIASFYAVVEPEFADGFKVTPEINRSRIVVRGNKVQHWLNGRLAVEYECGSDEVMAGVATSKFKDVPNFGKKLEGHIMLTDHGSECAFRNLKIRKLTTDD